MIVHSAHPHKSFLSTLSLRRATENQEPKPTRQNQFLSTLSLRRATRFIASRQLPAAFLSTLSLRRATSALLAIHTKSRISIHALLAESDANRCTTVPNFRYFYPRSPCGERHQKTSLQHPYCLFLSTLSLRRATTTLTFPGFGLEIFLSTLSLRRAT